MIVLNGKTTKGKKIQFQMTIIMNEEKKASNVLSGYAQQQQQQQDSRRIMENSGHLHFMVFFRINVCLFGYAKQNDDKMRWDEC